MPDARASRKRQIQITPSLYRDTGASRAFPTNGRDARIARLGTAFRALRSSRHVRLSNRHDVREAGSGFWGSSPCVCVCLTRQVEIA
jgi:hypothetical protein